MRARRLQRTQRALRPGGKLAVWSAVIAPEFEQRLRRAGFTTEVHTARARGSRGGRHTIYLARVG